LASDDLVARIVGESPIGAHLRPLVDRPLLAPGDGLAPILLEVETLFAALTRESRDPGPGARAMTAHYLGLLLIHLWRSCGLARDSEAFEAGAPTAQRFRQLVEMHYRDNLSVDDFALRLRVTRARLHNACLRTLGRPPQQLVHERLILEARLRLRDTAQSIEQVGYSLGFRDAAYFNRFFRRLSGLSPGAYRKASRVAAPREATSFSAWP
jgi:AraC family transcriptional activator of pobA